MNINSPCIGTREVVGMTIQSASNLVIDNLDEFAVGIFACATSSDYAISSL